MTKLIYSVLVATVLVAGISGAQARPVASSGLTDTSDQYGGFSPNSQAGNRAFWENQARGGH